jgi:hypothetical protein
MVGYVALAAALVPAHGLDGAVLAYVVEWGIALAVTAALLARRGLLRSGGPVIRVVAWSCAAAALSFALEPGRLAAAVVLVVFVVVLAVVGTTAEERAALRGRLRALARRS